MKRNLFYGLSVVFFTFILSACGTNSKSDSGNVIPSENGASASIVCFKIIDEELGPDKYKAHCYVHTVDANSNPINGLEYTVSVVANVKALNFEAGTIITTEPITFSDDSQTFVQSGIKKTDTLIVLPTESTTDVSYLGNWQIASVNSNTNLTLVERAFNLETTEGLSYVIGNETKYTYGLTGSAHIEYPEENNTSLTTSSDDGFFYFTLVFDYALEGETVYLAAYTGENRMGTARGIALIIDEDTNTTE